MNNLTSDLRGIVVALLILALGAGHSTAGDKETSEPIRGIVDCEVIRPTGSYALAVLHFTVPGDPKNKDRELRDPIKWSYVGGIRDGRMRVDDGVGLREAGGWIERSGANLKGTFRRVDLNADVSLDATIDGEGNISGNAKIGRRDATVQGVIYAEEELTKRNAIDPRWSWPSAQGPPMGGCSTQWTGVETIDNIEDLKMVWRCEESDIGRGMGNISRFMVTKWTDASQRRTGSGCGSALVANGKLYFKYFIPSPTISETENLPIAEYLFRAEPPKTGFIKATPKIAAERLLQQARDAGYKGAALPAYAAEKTFSKADDVILCADAATGKTLWKAVVKDRAINTQHHKVGPFDLSPAYANGRVFALSTSGWLYAFDAETGEPLWENKVSYDHSNALLAVGDLLVAPAGNGWGGYDASTGNLKWQTGGGRAVSTLSAWSHGGKDYLIGAMGPKHAPEGVSCLDAESGEKIWTLPIKVISKGRGLGPGGITIFRDTLLVNQDNGSGTEKEDVEAALAVYTLSTTKPQLQWQLGPLEGNANPDFNPNQWGCLHAESVPVVVRGKYVFTPDLRVVDLATGEVIDRGKGPKPMNGGYMQVIEDIVLVRQDGTHGEHAQFGFYKVSSDGSVHSFTETDWKPPVGGATSSYHHPIFYPAVDGRVFLRQENGIYCWDLRK